MNIALSHKPTNCESCGSNLLTFVRLLFGGISNKFKCRACEFSGYWNDKTKEQELDAFLSDTEMRILVKYALVGWKKNPTFSLDESKVMEKVKKFVEI